MIRVIMKDFHSIGQKIRQERLTGSLSSTAFTDTINNVKYIADYAAIWQNGDWLTCGEIVCDWLRAIGAKRHPARQSQIDNFLLRPPLLARTGYSKGNYAYFDIKSAYHSIYSRLRWQDELAANYHARGTVSLANFPYPEHKLARNAVIGIARGGASTKFVDGWITDRKLTAGFQNLHLINIINNILHYIADKAINLGAVYVNTDGYILPYGNGLILADMMQSEYQLTITQKSDTGAATVWGVGRYSVGNLQSATDNRSFRRYDFLCAYNKRALRLIM